MTPTSRGNPMTTDNGPRWCTGDNAEEIGIEEVSHWMPIAPPHGRRLIGEAVTDPEAAP